MSHNGIIPSLLVPEVYSPWKLEPGFVVRQVEAAAAEGFYRSVEFGSVPLAEDRRALRRVCAEHDIYVTCWLTDVLDAEQLDLTTIDETLRNRSVEAIKRVLPQAIECGARTVSLVGGPDPGPALRDKGYDSFYRSLTAICSVAADLGANVMFEPLDRFAHKKRLVSLTGEAVTAFARVRADHPDFGFAFDTAHCALNEEVVEDAIALAGEQVAHLHLSNAVLDKTDPAYGDHHMMPGAPGFLTLAQAVSILVAASRLCRSRSEGLRVAVEARAAPGSAVQSTAALAKSFLEDALRLVVT